MDDTHQSRASDAAATRKRRSSILKSQRTTRTPFSELEFNVATPTDTAKSRRVSFSRRTGVAEFVTNEATTTWKNFYEEHNKSLESSGNESGANASRQPVGHIGKHIFDQQFEEVEAVDFITSANPGVNITNSFNNINFEQQLASLECTDNIKLTAPHNRFEVSLIPSQSKVFDEFTIGKVELSERINVDFSSVKLIENDDLDEIQKDVAQNINNVICHGPTNGRNMSEYIEVDLDMTHVTVANDISDMSITDTIHSPKVQDVSKSTSIDKKVIAKDLLIDKENIAINPYIAPKEATNFAINEEPDKVLVFDGKRLKLQADGIPIDNNKPQPKDKPQRKTIVLNVNDDLPNFIDDPHSTATGYISVADLKNNIMFDSDMSITKPLNFNDTQNLDSNKRTIVYDDDTGNISITHAIPTNIIDKQKTFLYDSNMGDISMTQAVPNVIIPNVKRKTIVYDDNDCNISMTQALPVNIIADNTKRTIVYEDDTGNISITRAITKPIINENIKEKRKTIVYADDSINISVTQAVPANLIIENREKRRTVVFESSTGDISITQAIPTNIIGNVNKTIDHTNSTVVGNLSMTQALPAKIITQNNNEKRRTIMFENDDADISMTQAMPAQLIYKSNKHTTQYENDISLTEAIPNKVIQDLVRNDLDGKSTISVEINSDDKVIENKEVTEKVFNNLLLDVDKGDAIGDNRTEYNTLEPTVNENKLDIIQDISMTDDNVMAVDEPKLLTKEYKTKAIIHIKSPNYLINEEMNQVSEKNLLNEELNQVIVNEKKVDKSKPIPTDLLKLHEDFDKVMPKKSHIIDVAPVTEVLVYQLAQNVDNDKSRPIIGYKEYSEKELLEGVERKDSECFETEKLSINMDADEKTDNVDERPPSLENEELNTEIGRHILKSANNDLKADEEMEKNDTLKSDNNDLKSGGVMEKNDILKSANNDLKSDEEDNEHLKSDTEDNENLKPETDDDQKSETSDSKSVENSDDSKIDIVTKDLSVNIETMAETDKPQVDNIVEMEVDKICSPVKHDSPKQSENPVLNNLLDMSHESLLKHTEKMALDTSKSVKQSVTSFNAVSNDTLFHVTRDDDSPKQVTQDEVNEKDPIEFKKQKTSIVEELKKKLKKIRQSNDMSKKHKNKDSPDKDKRKSILKDDKNSCKNANDTKELLDLISDLTEKPLTLEPLEENVEQLVKQSPELEEKLETQTSVAKKLSPIQNRLSFAISKENLQISMAGQVLQKMELNDSINTTKESTHTISPETQKKLHMSKEVVKTLKFDDELYESPVKQCLLKKTAFGETSYMDKSYEKKSNVIPTYLKDVSDGLKQLMGDLLKPNGFEQFETPATNLRKSISTCSTQIQANLITSSQIDIGNSNTNLDNKSTEDSKHINTLKNPIQIDSETIKTEQSKLINDKVLEFDVDNPLNNVIIPTIDSNDVHKYNPNQSAINLVESVHDVVQTDDNNYIVSRIDNSKYGIMDAKVNKTISFDKCVDVKSDVKDSEVNTVIVMKGYKELLQESSSLTLVDDTVAKESRETLNSQAPFKVIYKLDENIEHDKLESETDTEDNRPKKRNYSPGLKKNSSDITPKPASKVQKVSRSNEKKIKKKGKNIVTVQQLLTEYNVEINDVMKTDDTSSVDTLSSYTSSKNLERSTISKASCKPSKMDWQTLSDDCMTNECDSSVNVVAKIDMMPFIGSHDCEWESSSRDMWSFRLLHSRLRLAIRLAHRHDNLTRTCVRADTPVVCVTLDTVPVEKVNPLGTLCVSYASEAMRYEVSQGCECAGGVPRLLRRCAAVARRATRWARAMHDAKLRLAYTLTHDGLVVLKVANIPLRSVWEVSFRISMMVSSGAGLPAPVVQQMQATCVVADRAVDASDLHARVKDVPHDWGHAPRVIWRIFKYLKNLTSESEILGF